MEDTSGVQAPVTRLRRRLSVEQSEDLNSPGPATPTKKRGGRLAAKPQLELIDENAGSTSKKSTKKAPVKELAETSEDKPLTPSRRSTRIRSNTSIISETALSVDSPRAKRAARRTSQVGSDNETVLTPVRMTRRTRKDSASSIDNLETTLAMKPANITEIIIEESEVHTQKPNDSPTNVPLRKSPRLKEKKKHNGKEKQNTDAVMEPADSMSNDTINDLNFASQDDNSESAENKSVTAANTEVTVPEKSQENSEETSFDIIKELDKKQKSKSSNPNKSMSALDNDNYFKSKRQRTKSLSIVSQSQTNDSAFLSDNEKNKKKVKTYCISKALKVSDYRFASGDSKLINTSIESDDKNPVSKNSDTCNLSPNESHSASDSLPNTISPKGNKENINVADNVVQESVLNFLKNPPSLVLQTTVIYEDSDTEKKNKVANKNIDSEDQCVPDVETRENCENFDKISSPSLNKSNKKNEEDENVLNNSSVSNKSKEIISKNNSCEPMDVDVTIPNNITFSETSQLEKSSDLGNLKSAHCEVNNTSLNKSSNKSKRKSSISLSTSQNLEKSGTENKSTLILSQIKDISCSENNVTKSPKPYQEILSKSTNSDIKNDNTMNKKNMSLDYSTSTPLQQRYLKEVGLQINTSFIENTKNDTKKSTKSPNISKKGISKSSDVNSSTDEESSSDNESSKIKSLLDIEADVASDDYESGDSQDDEERQYEEDNEIVEKGETLGSEDNISNDSDYEKDSFIVSSSDEDQNLLSGSGDDLSMSDNELTMSAKSKKKYNERKLKEQKKASKEMFEARHKLDANTKRSKQSQKYESSDDSDDEIIGHGKKNKHQRLDSTHEDNSDTSNSKYKSFNQKKKTKRLVSESDTNESVTKEPEITNVFNNSAIENDPLSTQVKQEPKTPLKDFNVSSVQIAEAIEEVVVEDKSFTKANQTSDPLHATMVDDDDLSSLSENSEIINNYDSILNQLNKESAKSKTIKSLDLSLDSINKQNNSKIPIVEELNLTHTKKSKRDKETDTLVGSDDVDSPKTKTTCAKVNKDISSNVDNDGSSESIDLHLLFSEDSNETSPNEMEKQDDYFIPLKRTPGKTNILNQQDNEQSTNDEIQFVIDTQGTREDTNNSHNTSLNSSTKKKNKKNKILNVSQTLVTHDNNSEDEGAPLEILFNSSKQSRIYINTILEDQEETKQHNNIPEISSSGSTKKKKIHSVTLDDQSDVPAAETSVQAPESTKKRKKKLHSESQKHEVADTDTTMEKLESAKKNKKQLSESHAEQTDTAEISLITPGSGKKKKNKSHIEQSDSNEAETSIVVSGSGKKKKQLSETNLDQSKDTAKTSLITPGSGKKKKNKSHIEQSDSNEAETSIVVSGSGKKKKQLSETNLDQSKDIPAEVLSNSKKRKRKSSGNTGENELGTEGEDIVPQAWDTSLSAGRQNKKRKVSQNETNSSGDEGMTENIDDCKERDSSQPSFEPDVTQRKNLKKRKRDSDDENQDAKKLKESSFDKVHVPRLPASILNLLDDKPKKEILDMKKSTVVSTTSFVVEEAKKRKNKPSAYLEETVYLNEHEHNEKKQKGHLKAPKVLPFVPTVTTSNSGFTTNFRIKIIPQEVKFVAQTKHVANFKTDHLYGNKIKRLGTYEMYKKHRSHKISKF